MIAPIAAVLLLAAATSLDQQLAGCHGIADDAKRLACYDALATPPPESSFGASTVVQKPAPEPDRIEAHVVGKVTGWRPGTLFTLDNGQIWKSVDDRRDDEVLDQPAATIKRNFFGHYWMDLAGTGQSIQVIRVK